ncbi:hypothetical protein KSP39_PZI021029 [Platanthera zijinensis]|uniref:PHD-type domain-containing protein n=1 Tax=Platanthera zijinensis TaxID=2320716 RepID=A0AAP0AYR3_9ASPA
MRTSGKKLTGCKYCTDENNFKMSSMPKNRSSSKLSNYKRWYLKPEYLKRKACNSIDCKRIEKPQKMSSCNLDEGISSFRLTGRRTCFTVGKNSKKSTRSAEKKPVRRRRLKSKNVSVVQDEVSCMQRRVRYLLIKMKLEQNLIDAYSGDGWKGQSREKIKPEKELQRAQIQITKYKLGIRDSIHKLELLGSEGRIEDSVMHPDGSVFHEYIFCAKCKSNEAFPDNDIILCDGSCNRGFHQKCLEPPLKKIPPGDQGWLCRICDCKVEILETINAYLGTCFTVDGSWEEIFKEAVASSGTDGVCPNLVEDWPSDDPEDEDYCPESNCKIAEFEENLAQDSCCSSDSVSSFDASLNLISCIGPSESSDEITNYRRQRRDVDYKKLYDEMFGKDPNDCEEQSEDEDWGPYRKKRLWNASDIGITPTDGEDKDSNEKLALRAKISCDKRSFFRIPTDAIEAEHTNHPHHASDVSVENEGHGHILDEAVSSDSSWLLPLASIFHLHRHKKRTRCRENLTSAISLVKKQKGASTSVHSPSLQVERRLRNATHLKKHVNANTMIAASEPLNSNEMMQILWVLERRLHQLKQRLLAIKGDNEAQVRRNPSGDGTVIYVPVAEIVEKAS